MKKPNNEAIKIEDLVKITIENSRDKNPIHAENIFHDMMVAIINKNLLDIDLANNSDSRISHLAKLYVCARKMRVEYQSK